MALHIYPDFTIYIIPFILLHYVEQRLRFGNYFCVGITIYVTRFSSILRLIRHGYFHEFSQKDVYVELIIDAVYFFCNINGQ